MAQTLDMSIQQYFDYCERASQRRKDEDARGNFREQDIRTNEHWHGQNLNMLEQCVAYARAREHLDVFLSTMHYYHMQESQRLQERGQIMQRYGIERLPHEHKAREKTLSTELIELLGGKH